jgi:arylsulfatase A-like enzyme
MFGLPTTALLRVLLCACLFLTPSNAAWQFFADPAELQQAVDVMLSGNASLATPLVATYGPIEEWDVSRITHFDNLFNARSRNPLAKNVSYDLSKWDVSSARFMHDMFLEASSMDFDVGSWDTSRVQYFNGMWEGATSFQGKGLEHWNVHSGTKFMVMFADTKTLSPTVDLRRWNVQSAESLTAMFRGSNFGPGSGIVSRQVMDEAPYNLCDWSWRLSPSAETNSMFVGTQCPDTTDPQIAGRGEGTVSFCVPCLNAPPKAQEANGIPAVDSDRPNVLFIMADQMRFDLIRHVQDEMPQYDDHFKIYTPNLDRLLKQGAYFETAYCQCAVCAPARTTLRTGCTIERTGIQHNDLIYEYKNGPIFQDRVEKLESLDHILVDKLGYVSEYYGKWHMPEPLATSKESGRPILQFNDYRYETDSFYYKYDDAALKTRRYLDHFEKLGEIDKSLPEETMQIDSYTRYPYTPIQLDPRWNMSTTPLQGDQFESAAIGQPNIMGPYKLSEKYTPSYFEGSVAVKALRRLREQRRAQGIPWFLTASFHSPHPPMVPAWKHLSKYWNNKSKLYVPASLNDDLKNSAYKTITDILPKYGEPALVQEWTALYYALIEEVDEHVGHLMDEVGDDASNTLIIFTSDHGEMLGAHGKRDKNNFYEESQRVPLLISFPGVIEPNTVVKDPVSHLDVFATIMDYINARDLDQSDGSSLRPYIQHDTDKVNRDFDQGAAIGEWDFRKVVPSNTAVLDRTVDERPSFMVRKGSYKLMMQKLADSNEMDMMFNLSDDPDERQNLLGKNAMGVSDEVAEKAEHLRCLLLDWMERLDGGVSGNEAYFSDPANNYHDNAGDIKEIRNRQKWKNVGLWSSNSEDQPLEFGQVSWTGSEFIRHEWLYLGTRLDESYTIASKTISGRDSVFFSIDDESVVGQVFGRNSCQAVRVSFRANVWAEVANVDATLTLSVRKSGEDAQRNLRVPLILGDVEFKTRRTTEMPVEVETSTGWQLRRLSLLGSFVVTSTMILLTL